MKRTQEQEYTESTEAKDELPQEEEEKLKEVVYMPLRMKSLIVMQLIHCFSCAIINRVKECLREADRLYVDQFCFGDEVVSFHIWRNGVISERRAVIDYECNRLRLTAPIPDEDGHFWLGSLPLDTHFAHDVVVALLQWWLSRLSRHL